MRFFVANEYPTPVIKKVKVADVRVHLPADTPVAVDAGANQGLEALTVLKGGPVETERGFVLHSADYFKAESTLPIDESENRD